MKKLGMNPLVFVVCQKSRIILLQHVKLRTNYYEYWLDFHQKNRSGYTVLFLKSTFCSDVDAVHRKYSRLSHTMKS